ncbi:hypothetical protein SELMODRAFT_439227 [Selaginella moellendorffii]|uniref:Delta(3)-Delta(2)-enoyl-CoA isomerase n=1 Tax=Selaginella moellendorffii TaxID=88036 RepID=D8R2V8_SELML|nr:enoyl-CoA delta isomerase 1, peroxisomal [Selaginella moellendorffii]EFJ33173.1 hypothetical protein SELMODRAFT_439227 [Selaginella moellendorffii]|eukprot:XP_002965753.1 enoyl-CoA delta isomerase 1, peroxisomal [Selaginella moellendorffii]
MGSEKSFVKLEALPHGVYVLKFDGGDGQHRLNPTSIAEIHSALDKVEDDPKAAALITTNEGKFFSNGLDLGFAQSRPGNFKYLVDLFHNLLDRFLCFPMPTIAAICGHAAAGGCMLALAHDYRVMRIDRGYIFMSEVEINLHMTPGMISLIRCKLPVATFHKSLLSAHKYTGKPAEEAGFVYASFPDARSTQEEAIQKATELAKKKYNRSIYKAIKSEMFRVELRDLRSGDHGPPPGIILSKI